jgi:hypothetical protein
MSQVVHKVKRNIEYNPARDVEKPKGQSEHNEDEGLNILMPYQIKALIDNTSDLNFKNFL